jgi:hypothetical protein
MPVEAAHRMAPAGVCLQDECVEGCTIRLLGIAWNRVSKDWQLASHHNSQVGFSPQRISCL